MPPNCIVLALYGSPVSGFIEFPHSSHSDAKAPIVIVELQHLDFISLLDISITYFISILKAIFEAIMSEVGSTHISR